MSSDDDVMKKVNELSIEYVEKCIECDFVGVLNMDKFPTGVCEKNPEESGNGTEIIVQC